MSNNPFDFTDLSDLPEDLQKKLHTDTSDNAKTYADVVKAGNAAGVTELDINQIIAAATRMGMEPPTQQTVRNYLNKAVELGLIAKPTRQTYGIVPADEEAPAEAPKAVKGKGAKAAAVETADPVATAEVDPLAGL